ncbi:MAG: beta-lactamase family protein [Acidobacteriota bacterium]|nr:beta-lactamase family protein [Acidobacteriota bacterium]
MRPKILATLTLFLTVCAAFAADITTFDQRAAATVAAFNGTAEEFEAFVASGYAPKLRERSNPESRKEFFQRLRGDFGTVKIAGPIKVVSETKAVVPVEGSTGLRGAFILEHEKEAPFLITMFSVDVGGEGDEKEIPPPPIDGKMNAKQLTSALGGYMKKLSDAGDFSGVVLVARNGKPVFEQAYGMASRAYKVPNTTATRFDIGSINKQFTRVAIGQLMMEGKLTPDDTIGKLLPDYPNENARKATIAQLIDHRGGLADFFGPDLGAMSRERFRSNHDWYLYTSPKALLFEPGTKKQYCNSCYVVLGEMVERLSGMPYERYIERNVFARGGITHSGFFHDDDIVPDLATGYSLALGGGKVRSNILVHGAAPNAAGGAYMTAADLLAFDNALSNAKLLDAKTTAWFFKMPASTQPPFIAEGMYAGGMMGVNAAVATGGEWTVVALANIDPPAAEGLAPVIWKALAGK